MKLTEDDVRRIVREELDHIIKYSKVVDGKIVLTKPPPAIPKMGVKGL